MRQSQRQRRRSFLPRAEHLEPRIVLSAQIGVNLDGNASYNNDPIWTDLHNLALPWEAPTTTMGSSAADTAIPLTATEYPLANAATTFTLVNYPDGDYQFSYTGTATVTFTDIGYLSGPVTVSGGVTTGTVVVNHQTGDKKDLDMQVTGLNSADPMGNFHLMMPGYGNGTTAVPMYTPAFIESLQPFSDIRFMNWEMTNDSTLANWSDRATPADFIDTASTNAVPYEDMIELCNEAQKDLWINVPALATPAFDQSLAQLVNADLDPNLNVYVEYSNETWNTGFSAFWQAYAAAQTNPLVIQNGNESQMVAQQAAYEEVSIAKIFDQTFGAQASRVRPIMAAQQAWSQIASWQLQFIQQNYGPPSQFIYAASVADYATLPNGDNVAGLTLNQLFADLNQYLTSDDVPWIKADAAVASQYGLPLVGYEGGQAMAAGANNLNYSVIQQAEIDPRMYQFYVAMEQDWQEYGGGLINEYVLADGSFWGMLPNVLATGSQKYDALLSMLLPAGDANLDGIVNYDDFQILEANYGTTNDYWEQGDFNDDGTVNSQDLNLLRQNLDPAGFTVSQFAQQALFGELSTVDSPTALEYDGYGVTYASSLPFAASSGTVKLNLNSRGQAIVLGGAGYSEGLGVLANSSVSLALDGQDTRFESTIGVNGTSNSGSSVIFNVYGDGRLLYQSPTMTYASGAIPIDVNVAGVTTLTLTVSPAPGSSPSIDNAVWADARLVSTANFGSTQPYSLTWQLSQNGTVLSTQTTDSFVFGAISGTYTLTLTVTDAQGDTATASTNVSVVTAAASAQFLFDDAEEGGDWVGNFGSQGYDLIGNAVSLPSYATVTTSGASTYIWTTSTTVSQALKNPAGSNRVVACWYSGSSFTVDVNLIDGQSHNLALYFLDYDTTGRGEQVQISNATTKAVLDTETVSSFHMGIYLEWVISGNVLITFTRTAGANAVLSGLFLDPSSISSQTATAAFIGDDNATEGNWIGTYGTQGYDIIGNAASLPSYATVTPSGQSSYTWRSDDRPARPFRTQAVRVASPPAGTRARVSRWTWT